MRKIRTHQKGGGKINQRDPSSRKKRTKKKKQKGGDPYLRSLNRKNPFTKVQKNLRKGAGVALVGTAAALAGDYIYFDHLKNDAALQAWALDPESDATRENTSFGEFLGMQKDYVEDAYLDWWNTPSIDDMDKIRDAYETNEGPPQVHDYYTVTLGDDHTYIFDASEGVLGDKGEPAPEGFLGHGLVISEVGADDVLDGDCPRTCTIVPIIHDGNLEYVQTDDDGKYYELANAPALPPSGTDNDFEFLTQTCGHDLSECENIKTNFDDWPGGPPCENDNLDSRNCQWILVRGEWRLQPPIDILRGNEPLHVVSGTGGDNYLCNGTEVHPTNCVLLDREGVGISDVGSYEEYGNYICDGALPPHCTELHNTHPTITNPAPPYREIEHGGKTYLCDSGSSDCYEMNITRSDNDIYPNDCVGMFSDNCPEYPHSVGEGDKIYVCKLSDSDELTDCMLESQWDPPDDYCDHMDPTEASQNQWSTYLHFCFDNETPAPGDPSANPPTNPWPAPGWVPWGAGEGCHCTAGSPCWSSDSEKGEWLLNAVTSDARLNAVDDASHLGNYIC